MKFANDLIQRLQLILDFDGYQNPQFLKNGIGKIGTAAFILGTLFGFNLCLTIVTIISTFLLRSYFYFILCIWSIFVTFLMGFHFLEFFITAVKQPKSVSYQSFIINHSKAYTIATSKIFFFLTIYNFYFLYNSHYIFSFTYIYSIKCIGILD